MLNADASDMENKNRAYPYLRRLLPETAQMYDPLLSIQSPKLTQRLTRLADYAYKLMKHYTIQGPALVAQGVSAHRTGHILEALLPQGELRE